VRHGQEKGEQQREYGGLLGMTTRGNSDKISAGGAAARSEPKRCGYTPGQGQKRREGVWGLSERVGLAAAFEFQAGGLFLEEVWVRAEAVLARPLHESSAEDRASPGPCITRYYRCYCTTRDRS